MWGRTVNGIPVLSPVDAAVRRHELSIRWYRQEGRPVADAIFQISGVAATPDMIQTAAWHLPGLAIGVQSSLGAPTVERKGQVLEVRYRFPAASAEDATMTMSCEPTQA